MTARYIVDALRELQRVYGPLSDRDVRVVAASRFGDEDRSAGRQRALGALLDELDDQFGPLSADDITAAFDTLREADAAVPDGWALGPDGQPYPEGVATDSSGWPMEAAGYYALREALERAGSVDPGVDAWNGLVALRGMGFDIVWERRSDMQRQLDRLRALVRELVPWARGGAAWSLVDFDRRSDRTTTPAFDPETFERVDRPGARGLLDRIDAGEFDL